MKKILFTIVVTLVFIGCSKESTIEQLSKEVEVSLDFSFTESGSMTRAGSTVYADFYNKYIKTKQLTPKTFNLTFKNKETGATATIRGSWNKKHSFKLLTGDYEVIGTSYPYGIHSAACIDSLYLKFNEKITSAENSIRNGIEKIKGLFHFSWKLPDLKTPHFSITGSFGLKPPSVPKITTKWFAEGGIMTSPTIFGENGNQLLGGGEAGDEAILPLSSLWDKMGQFIHKEMNDSEGAEKSEASYFNTITQREMHSVSSFKETTGSSIKERQITEKEGKIVIQKLEIKVDPKNIKELKMLEKLINELTDAQNSSGEPEPA